MRFIGGAWRYGGDKAVGVGEEVSEPASSDEESEVEPEKDALDFSQRAQPNYQLM